MDLELFSLENEGEKQEKKVFRERIHDLI